MSFDHVFTPLKIGSLEVKNRVLLAPMEGTEMIDWLMSRKSRADQLHDYHKVPVYLETATKAIKDGAIVV